MQKFCRFALVLGILIPLCASQGEENYPEPCNNPIYCHGDLLQTIQLNHIYHPDPSKQFDDKPFVDLPLKLSQAEVLQNFRVLNITGVLPENDTVSRQLLTGFLYANFDNVTTEFEKWNPPQIDNPKFLDGIEDPRLKQFAIDLHGFWEELGRNIKVDVDNRPEYYSMHYVSHPVIVPGGRFKELYYWDSYWIQKGLIVSEMTETVKGMIENFSELVEKLGYIPNGGRIYYERSQPPLYIPMAKNYYDATNDTAFIVANMHWMEKEFAFFMEERTVNVTSPLGSNHTMARYNVQRKGPRPESYSKDYELVHPLDLTEAEEAAMYSNLKAGAESGWDFSSRWFKVPDGENESKVNLSHTKTRDIIPVDLNGFLYWNAVILGEFCKMETVNCSETVSYYEEKAMQWKTAIQAVLWDEEEGSWFDYDFVKEERRKEFYPTNVVPLWVKAHHHNSTIQRFVQYFKNSGANSYPAGIPSSLKPTGEQWDYPNGWAPLNHMVVEALEYSGDTDAQALAFDLAQRWVRTNHLAYMTHNKTMFEKYDVTCQGCAGGGGEYEVVVGFGWTNGVILDFLKLYGDRVTAQPEDPQTTTQISQPVTTTTTSTQPGDKGGASSKGHLGVLSLLTLTLSLLLLHKE